MNSSPDTRPSRRATPSLNDSTLRCQTVRIGTRRTSLRLEPEMWEALDSITRQTGHTLPQVMMAIDLYRQQSSLTSAVRVVILRFFRAAALQSGTPAQWLDAAIRPHRATHPERQRA
ncbi:MAG: ribbon-helix-helix domain-containing protein [Elstera sp.]